MNFNLILAGVWLFVGIVFMTLQARDPANPAYVIFNTGISIGWVALLLAVYNLARWYSLRSAAKLRRLEAERSLHRPGPEGHRDSGSTLDPELDLSEPPPSSPAERREPSG